MHLGDVGAPPAPQRTFGVLAKKRVLVDIEEEHMLMAHDPLSLHKCRRTSSAPSAVKSVREAASPGHALRSATLEDIVGSKLCPKQAPTAIGELWPLQNA